MSFFDQLAAEEQRKRGLPPAVEGVPGGLYRPPPIPGQPVVDPMTGQEYPSPGSTGPSNITKEDVGRFALEAGGSLLGLAAPEVGVPVQAARILGPHIVRGLGHYLPKILASGAGAGSGSLVSETFDPSKAKDPLGKYEPEGSLRHAMEAASHAAKLGFASEVVGQTVGHGLRGAAKPPTLQPGALEAQRLLGQHGASLTTGQATQSRFLDFLENVSESGFLRTQTQKVKEHGEATAQGILKDILQGYSARGTTKNVGVELQAAIETKVNAFKAQGNQLYDNLDQMLLSNPVVVDTRRIKQRALLLRHGYVLKDSPTSGLIDQIAQLPDQVSFGHAQQLRSDLLAVSGDPSALIKGRRKNMASILSGETDNAMETAGKQLPQNTPAYEAWRRANAWWKGEEVGQEFGIGILKDPVIQKILTDDPGVIVDTLLRRGKFEGFAMAMKILPQPVADGVRREFLDRALTGAVREAPGKAGTHVSGAAAELSLGIATPYSAEAAAFKGLFNDVERREVEAAVKALRLTQSSSPSQLYTLVMRGVQIGGVTSLMSAGKSGYGPVVMMTPHVAAWLINNPISRKLLIRGLGAPVGTPESITAATKLLVFAKQNGIPVTGGGHWGVQRYNQNLPETAPPTDLDIGPHLPAFNSLAPSIVTPH